MWIRASRQGLTIYDFFYTLKSMRLALYICALCFLLGAAGSSSGEQVEVHLKDGSVIVGELVEATPLLVILRVQGEIYTFEVQEVERIVLSEPSEARGPTWRFPRLGFLGGTLAGGVIAWWGFDSASRKERDARLQEEYGLFQRAGELRREARRDRKIAWAGVVGGIVCTAVALIPERTGSPKLEARIGESLQVTMVYSF
ncbi:MAG: hypothetical protein DRP95_00430 [Candidatus Latescibacterota bacterium]|nr:MAG: hypothetical protein DRP95_00430 [Candidatus Latescibacterota bacterium]